MPLRRCTSSQHPALHSFSRVAYSNWTPKHILDIWLSNVWTRQAECQMLGIGMTDLVRWQCSKTVWRLDVIMALRLFLEYFHQNTYSRWGLLALCQVSIFSLVWFQRWRSKIVPTWLTHHMTYDVKIMIKTFYMGVAPMVKILSKSDKQLRRKTRKFGADRQTNRQTNKQAVIDWYLWNRQLDLWPSLLHRNSYRNLQSVSQNL